MNVRELISSYKDAWNAHDLDAVCALHAPGMVFENHTAGERAEGDAVREHIAGIFALTDALILRKNVYSASHRPRQVT